MLVTIFTPVYNRAHTLERLYKSLIAQTNKDFEWLIINDGSTDNSEEVIETFIKEEKININYLKCENGGKHRAINKGVALAKGELFYIVDSDDYLPEKAVEIIQINYEEIKDYSEYAGICGLDKTIEGKVLSNFPPGINYIDATPHEFRNKYKIKGDLAEVFKTAVFKKFPFPEIDGEKFVPEILVWNRISKSNLKLRYIPAVLKIIEYLPDGLTASIVKVRMQSPISSCMCYAEMLKLKKLPLLLQIKSAINYWRFYYCLKKRVKPSFPFKWHLWAPVGFIFHLKDGRLKD